VTARHPAPPVAARPAYRDGNVLRWLTAYAASAVGDNVYFLALGWTARQVASPAQVGLVLAAAAVPRAVLMLGGGVVADRWGPRAVVLGSDAVRCVVVFTVAAVLALAEPGLWLLTSLALVFGVVDALFMPAVGAMPPRITARSQLARVQGMRSLVVRVGNTVGPPVSGYVMASGGAAAAFALAGCLFALSLALLLAVRVAGPAVAEAGEAAPARSLSGSSRAERGAAWRELVDGLHHVRRNPVLCPLVVGGALSEVALSGPLNVGLVLLAGQRGWGASGMAWIVSAFGAGAGLSGLLITVLGRLPRAGTVQPVALVLASAGVGAVALAPGLGGAVALAGISGLVASVSGSLSSALVQSAADPAYLGRVTAVTSFSAFGLSPLSYPLFGGAAAAWGIGPVYVVCGALGMAGAAVTFAAPAARRAELPRTREAVETARPGTDAG
jgi:MFS family permease